MIRRYELKEKKYEYVRRFYDLECTLGVPFNSKTFQAITTSDQIMLYLGYNNIQFLGGRAS